MSIRISTHHSGLFCSRKPFVNSITPGRNHFRTVNGNMSPDLRLQVVTVIYALDSLQDIGQFLGLCEECNTAVTNMATQLPNRTVYAIKTCFLFTSLRVSIA